MLLDFEIRNWKSFKDKNFITSIASREEQHTKRRAYIPKFSMNVLPALGIFGGNASGKSNFIDALKFIKELVVNYQDIQTSIPVKRYLLDDEYSKGNSDFYLQILINDNIYHLSISLNEKRILSEKLEFENSSRKYVLYERQEDTIVLGEKLKNSSVLKVIAAGTRSNRLFLSNTIDQQAKEFQDVFNWFEKIKVIEPSSYLLQDKLDIDEYMDALNEYLPRLDTGITEVDFKDVDINNTQVPEVIMNQILSSFDNNNAEHAILSNRQGLVLRFDKDENNNLKASELVARHMTAKGTKDFNLSMESMGTLRAIELIPLFFELSKGASVIVIDEVDRSLHTNMTRGLIEYYLGNYNKNSRSQLIFTCHDTNLLTQELFRRDELWLVERNKFCESNIYSIGDFKDVKKNNRLDNLYIQGRLGGTPRINI